MFTRLLCENLKKPLGIGTADPRLSWALSPKSPVLQQAACRLVVAAEGIPLKEGRPPAPGYWDSGRVESSRSLHVPVALKLESSTRYFWKVKDVAAMLKAIHACEDAVAAREKAGLVMDKLRSMKLHKAAELLQEGLEETLCYMAFPREHWRSLRTNNPLERLMKEVRRRTRVVGAFPDGKSALMLVAARLRHVTGTQWGLRRYLDMSRLAENDKSKPEERTA